MNVRLEPVTIEGVENGEGILAFCDDRLVAVFVRLSAAQGDEEGAWFLEKGFGTLDDAAHPTFPDLGAVRRWLRAALADRAGGPPGPRAV